MFAAMGFAQKTFDISVTNNSKVERTNAPVVLQLDNYGDGIKSALVTMDGKEIPCQLGLDTATGTGTYRHDDILHTVCRTPRLFGGHKVQQECRRIQVCNGNHQREELHRAQRQERTARMLGHRLARIGKRQCGTQARDRGTWHLHTVRIYRERRTCQQGQLRFCFEYTDRQASLRHRVLQRQRDIRHAQRQRLV